MISMYSFRDLVKHLGDKEKAFKWFSETQFSLGNKTPNDVIRSGNPRKVERYIDDLINYRL